MATILAVDDDINYLLSLRNLLTAKGYKVEVIFNPFLVENYLRGHKVDCLLLDLKMPGLSGMALLQKIGKNWPQLPVIIVSALELEELSENPLQLGAQAFIEKPFNVEELLSAIETALQTAH